MRTTVDVMQNQYTARSSARAEQWIIQWRDFLAAHPRLNTIGGIPELHVPDVPSQQLAEDDVFWNRVASYFPSSNEFINLNNGAVSSSPHIVEKAYTTYYSLLNSSPSFFTWKEMEPVREVIREGLATLLNVSCDEVAILRNTTEAMNNLIFGVELKEGDEVVACKQDYAKTVSSWKQRELRDKIKLTWVEIDGTETNEEVVAKYATAFSSKTKVVQITHVINWNGQVLPVKEIIDEAKKRNIAVMVDGAHGFGVLETDLKQWDCEYYAATLHKWLSGPITGGLVYIRKDKISGTWPLASSATPQSADIKKFEELSIQLLPNITSLGYAIAVHLSLTRANKEARLRTLRHYWISQIKEIESIKFNTPVHEDQCAVIVNIAVRGWIPTDLERELFEHYGLHVGCVMWENMEGVRITPSIYTSKEELQVLVGALKKITLER